MHWNGKRWSVVSTPNPGGSKPGLLSDLADVTCVTSANCWAVGEFGNDSGGKKLNQVLHWNGKRWSQVRVVNPGGTKSGDRNGLLAVRCGSARNCNAVGYYGKNVAPQRNEVLHWNGTRWSHASAPNPAGTGSSAANDLQALACGSGTNCWAAGYASNGTTHNQMLHWNGRSWTKATVPNPNANTPLVDNELLGCDLQLDPQLLGRRAAGHPGFDGHHERGPALERQALVAGLDAEPGWHRLSELRQQTAQRALHVRLQLLGGGRAVHRRRLPPGDPVLERREVVGVLSCPRGHRGIPRAPAACISDR